MYKSLKSDTRGVTIQIGALLLFATAIITFAAYQSTIVAQQNEQIEFDHSQTIVSDMIDLRDAILQASGRSVETSAGLQLGTTYPARAVAANPPPSAGTISTTGTTDATVAVNITNATATDAEASDFWNGTQRNYSTGFVTYEPQYSEYENGPTVRLDNTVLYREYRTDSRVSAGEALVNERDITLIIINGSLRKQSATKESISITPLSTNQEPIQITNTSSSEPVTISFNSTRGSEAWKTYLSEEYDAESGDTDPDAYIADISSTEHAPGQYTVTLTFETGTTYNLRMAKVGIGTQLGDTTAAYLDPVAETAQIQQNERTKFTVTVRDRYNNPVSGVSVNASVDPASDGTITSDTTAVSDADGEVSFVYQSQDETGTQQVNVSLGALGTHSKTEAESTEFNIIVQSSSGSGGESGSGTASLSPNCLENATATGSGSEAQLSFDISKNASCGSFNITEFTLYVDSSQRDDLNIEKIRTKNNEPAEVKISVPGQQDITKESQGGQGFEIGNTEKYSLEPNATVSGDVDVGLVFRDLLNSDGSKVKIKDKAVTSDDKYDIVVKLTLSDGDSQLTTKKIYFRVTNVDS